MSLFLELMQYQPDFQPERSCFFNFYLQLMAGILSGLKF